MEKKLQQSVDSFNAFTKFSRENELVWISVTAYGIALTALELKVKSIIVTESQQEENNKGVTRTKDEQKSEMANEAIGVAQALQGYAISIGDNDLFDLMSTSYTNIYRVKNSEAIAAAQRVFDTASALPIASLQPFGISATVLTTLKTSIENFIAVAPSTRNVKAHRLVLTKNLTQLVKEANTLMRKNLLKIARQFKKTNPDFYAGLVGNAKVIRHTLHARLRLTVTDAKTKNVLPGALIEIEGTELKGMTDMKGKCTVTLVPAGMQTITVKKTGYEVYVMKDVEFKKGKAVTAAIAMEPEKVNVAQPVVVVSA